jgi:hypothetical protein
MAPVPAILSASDPLRPAGRAREAVASDDEMLVGAAKEVSAGAADHQWCGIHPAGRQSPISMAALLGVVLGGHQQGGRGAVRRGEAVDVRLFGG